MKGNFLDTHVWSVVVCSAFFGTCLLFFSGVETTCPRIINYEFSPAWSELAISACPAPVREARYLCHSLQMREIELLFWWSPRVVCARQLSHNFLYFLRSSTAYHTSCVVTTIELLLLFRFAPLPYLLCTTSLWLWMETKHIKQWTWCAIQPRPRNAPCVWCDATRCSEVRRLPANS